MLYSFLQEAVRARASRTPSKISIARNTSRGCLVVLVVLAGAVVIGEIAVATPVMA